jgi:hypothetical protein
VGRGAHEGLGSSPVFADGFGRVGVSAGGSLVLSLVGHPWPLAAHETASRPPVSGAFKRRPRPPPALTPVFPADRKPHGGRVRGGQRSALKVPGPMDGERAVSSQRGEHGCDPNGRSMSTSCKGPQDQDGPAETHRIGFHQQQDQATHIRTTSPSYPFTPSTLMAYVRAIRDTPFCSWRRTGHANIYSVRPFSSAP